MSRIFAVVTLVLLGAASIFVAAGTWNLGTSVVHSVGSMFFASIEAEQAAPEPAQKVAVTGGLPTLTLPVGQRLQGIGPMTPDGKHTYIACDTRGPSAPSDSIPRVCTIWEPSGGVPNTMKATFRFQEQ